MATHPAFPRVRLFGSVDMDDKHPKGVSVQQHVKRGPVHLVSFNDVQGQSKKTERVLTGGTCFDAPTRYSNERSFDGLIILTDMEAPKPIPSKAQRMWMTTPECKERAYFQTNERVIAID